MQTSGKPIPVEGAPLPAAPPAPLASEAPARGGIALRTARTLVVVGGAAFLALFLYVTARRLAFSFELEWMEGGELLHAVRLRTGLPLYGPPSADFVAFFYPPGYPAVVAALASVTGSVTFALGRAVSLGATLATLAMLFAMARRETRSWKAGLVAAGLYAALFRFDGAFYDIARPDALALALVVAAAWVARGARRPWQGAAAAVLFVAAYFTKQTAAVMAVALVIPWWRRDRRGALTYAVTGALAGGLGALLLTRATGGWFWFYVAKGHAGHAFFWRNILFEYWRDLLFLAGGLLLFPLAFLSHTRRAVALGLAAFLVATFVQRAATLNYEPHMYYGELLYESPRVLVLVPPLMMAALLGSLRWRGPVPLAIDPFWWWAFAGALLASGLNHSTQWAYANCFMPMAAFGSVLSALVLHAFLAAPACDAPSGRSAPAVLALAPAALVVQLAALAYNPLRQVPGRRDATALAVFTQRLQAIHGKVLVPAHPLAAYAHDGVTHLHQMNVDDVTFAGGIPDLKPRLLHGEWEAVVLDTDSEMPNLDATYYLSEELTYPSQRALLTRTGVETRPLWLWRRKNEAPRELAPGITGDFEHGAFVGWEAHGAAFGEAARQARTLAHLKNLQGRFAASSRGTPPGGPSTLTSQPFVVTNPRLSFLLAGTPRGSVRVLEGDREVARKSPRDEGRLQPFSFDLRALALHTVRVQIADDGSGEPSEGAGITVDDLRLVL